MKRKYKQKILIVIGILLIGLPIVDLIKAKLKTEDIVQELLKPEHCKIKFQTISEDRIQNLLTVEDPTFYKHNGLDFTSLGAGWTTISQGLVKLLYFRKFKPGIAKIRLILITRFVFNPSVSKQDQLVLFYNYAYLGHDHQGMALKGFANASLFYYKKEFEELENEEYLSLIAMLINPNKYRIDKYPVENKERVERIKRLINGDCVPNDWKDGSLEGCK